MTVCSIQLQLRELSIMTMEGVSSIHKENIEFGRLYKKAKISSWKYYFSSPFYFARFYFLSTAYISTWARGYRVSVFCGPHTKWIFN